MFIQDTEKGFFDCPFNPEFLIWKNSSFHTWELCLKNVNNSDGYPEIIGKIYGGVGGGMPGSLIQATNLGWEIKEEYRGQGYMTRLLELYLQEVVPDVNGFAVVISKANVASFRLAIQSGFEIYEENEDNIFLYRK